MSLSLFYNHVTVLDYAFINEFLKVQGGSFIVDVELVGSTGSEGVIFDFSLAKKAVKQLIDEYCDHRLLVPKLNKNIRYKVDKDHAELECGTLRYKAPLSAFCLLESHIVDEQAISRYLESIILPQMPSEVSQVKIKLRYEAGNKEELFLSYTHGLKQHYGNCQRLLHGHRSSLQVFIDCKRSHALEKWLINDLFRGSIHFAFKENVDAVTHKISYTSSQGDFSLELPEDEIYILPIETTVENLSSYFRKLCLTKFPDREIEVVAYEGVGKGAKSS